MFGHHNRRPEYEEQVPVYPSEGYGPREGVSEDYGPSYAPPPPTEVLYEEGRVPYGRPEYADGYGRREDGYGAPGYVRGEGEYGREGYGGYGVPPPRVQYVEPYSSEGGGSDLGMGARDSGISAGPDYGAGYRQPVGYGQSVGYNDRGQQQEAEIEKLQEELKTERRRKVEAEAAAAAAVGYGIYEHHEKSQEEEGAPVERKHHGFFGL